MLIGVYSPQTTANAEIVIRVLDGWAGNHTCYHGCSCRTFARIAPPDFTALSAMIQPIKLQHPKSWRWFDAFRLPARPVLLAARDALLERVKRILRYTDAAQARRHKRKRFVQRLRGASA